MFFQGMYSMLLFHHMGSSSLQWHSSWPLLLTASALAALGVPYGHRRLWRRPGLSFLFPLLTAALIPFHGGKTSDPRAVPASLSIRLLPARSGWHTYPSTSTGR